MNVTGVGGFQKGRVANPTGANGRYPRTSAELELRSLAQKWGKKAVATAARIMEDEEVQPGTRLQAADLLLNRGYGKPIQPHANPDLSPIDFNSMGTEELLGVLRRIETQLNNVPDAGDIVAATAASSLGKFQG
jgi:hypothetical protein